MPYDVIEFRAFRPIGGKKPTERDTRETNTFPRPCKPAHPCAHLTLHRRGFFVEVRCYDNEEKDGGIFISSGILIEKEEEVADAVRRAGFDIIEIAEDGEWCAIAAEKRQI